MESILCRKDAIDGNKVRIYQVVCREVFLQQSLEKLNRFPFRGVDIRIGEVQVEPRVYSDTVKTIQMHPLAHKSLMEIFCSDVRHEPLGLFQENRLFKERSIACQFEQRLIRGPAP